LKSKENRVESFATWEKSPRGSASLVLTFDHERGGDEKIQANAPNEGAALGKLFTTKTKRSPPALKESKRQRGEEARERPGRKRYKG